MSVAEELARVGRVGAAKDNGGGGHSGGGFTGEIRPGIARVNLVSSAVSGHVLGSLPAIVVTITISHLTK